jgi:hypothetical protein
VVGRVEHGRVMRQHEDLVGRKKQRAFFTDTPDAASFYALARVAGGRG